MLKATVTSRHSKDQHDDQQAHELVTKYISNSARHIIKLGGGTLERPGDLGVPALWHRAQIAARTQLWRTHTELASSTHVGMSRDDQRRRTPRGTSPSVHQHIDVNTYLAQYQDVKMLPPGLALARPAFAGPIEGQVSHDT